MKACEQCEQWKGYFTQVVEARDFWLRSARQWRALALLAILVSLVVLLSACGAPPECVTASGSRGYGANLNCARLQDAEDAALGGLGARFGVEAVRHKLAGVSVHVESGWLVHDGRRGYASGWTGDITFAVMTFENGADNWGVSPYAHELVHLLDTSPCADTHCGWEERGLEQAIQDSMF